MKGYKMKQTQLAVTVARAAARQLSTIRWVRWPYATIYLRTALEIDSSVDSGGDKWLSVCDRLKIRILYKERHYIMMHFVDMWKTLRQ